MHEPAESPKQPSLDGVHRSHGLVMSDPTVMIEPGPSETFRLLAALTIERAREDVFSFFADAHNLEAITPPWLRFRVLTPRPIRMRHGTEVEYGLTLHGVPVRWRSEIARWNPPGGFVDRQIEGPYRLWIHAHRFTELDGRTLVEDEVRYAMTGGRLAQRLLVGRDLRAIFEYRHERLLERFG